MVREVHIACMFDIPSFIHSFSWRSFHTQEEVSMYYLRSNPLFCTTSLRQPTSNYHFFGKSFAETFNQLLLQALLSEDIIRFEVHVTNNELHLTGRSLYREIFYGTDFAIFSLRASHNLGKAKRKRCPCTEPSLV